jgi:hypothetical protein
MAFTYETVTIDAIVYNVYTIVADADAYLGASLYATDWTGALADDKARALVMATRLIDRQAWLGAKTEAANTQDWPRSGLEDEEGTAISSATIPQFLKDATCELALDLLGDSDTETFEKEPEISSVGAGSARVEFFRSAATGFKRFPTVVQELLGDFLAASNSSGIIPYASGTDELIVDIHSDLNEGYA